MASGLETDWCLVDELPTLGESRKVVWTGRGMLRFDYWSNAWVADPELAGIFVGKLLTLPLTERQAKGVVTRSGGTWVDPPRTASSDRVDQLLEQAVDNSNSVPVPAGAELIEDIGTFVPFWLSESDGSDSEPASTVLWTAGNGLRIQRFDYQADAWVRDPRIRSTFIGTPDTAPITEEHARETIERNGGTWKVPQDRK